MTDPFSVVAGVLGILSSIIAASKLVTETLGDISEANSEIGCLLEDCHAFFSVVRSLDIALREQNVQDTVGSDPAILDMISNLAEPLRNCYAVLTDLMVKMRKQPRLPDGKGFSMGLRNLKWTLSTKDEARRIQLRLEATKPTLNNALDAVNLLLSLRSNGLLLAMGKSFDAFAIRDFCDYTQTSPDLPLSSRTRCSEPLQENHEDYQPHIKKLIFAPEQPVLDSVRSLVHHTHQYVMLDDHLLCQQVARTYREVGEQLIKMQQLRNTIGPHEQSSHRSNKANTASDEDGVGLDVQNRHAAAHDSSTAEVFLNCMSTFSATDISSSIDRLRASFSGSPDYSLETSSSFYPEQYIVASQGRAMFVTAILPLPNHPRSQRYFITLQEKPRRWQRVFVEATFDNLIDCSAMMQISTPDNVHVRPLVLPTLVKSQVRKVLQDIELFGTITTISIHLKEDDNGSITADIARVKIAEDMNEREMSNEDKILQGLEHLGCCQFRESEIIVKSLFRSYLVNVCVRGASYLERKVPFASAGCTGIAQFIGIVLDDAGRHLKGYSCEAPVIPSLRSFIGFANSLAKTIPWPIRELWILQIISAISNLHATGFVLGALNLNRISVRADLTVALELSDCARRHLSTTLDCLPPELLNTIPFGSFRMPSNTVLNFQTDVFQLGFIIWLIAEHRPGAWGYYCIRAVCTSLPRYQCTASHTEPTDLPPCSTGIPSYLNHIIKACRLPNPKTRPAARNLAKMFTYTKAETESNYSVVVELMREFPSLSVRHFFCEECGYVSDVHYHCYICNLGNFDLCPSCVDAGIHCWIPQHRLAKRTVKDGEIVDAD